MWLEFSVWLDHLSAALTSSTSVGICGWAESLKSGRPTSFLSPTTASQSTCPLLGQSGDTITDVSLSSSLLHPEWPLTPLPDEWLRASACPPNARKTQG